MKKWLKRFAPALLISIVVTIFMGLIYERGVLEGFESRIYNSKLVLRGQIPQTGNVVIAVIDDYSVDPYRLGRWPWSREYVGMLVDSLNNYGAKVIGFDVFFPEPDTSVPIAGMRNYLRMEFELLGLADPILKGKEKNVFLANLREFYDKLLGAEFERNPNIDAVADQVETDLNPDNRFAQVLSRYDNVVLGYYFGEMLRAKIYATNIDSWYDDVEKTLAESGLEVPEWLTEDRDKLVDFVFDIENKIGAHRSYEDLKKDVFTFAKSFEQRAASAGESSKKYQDVEKNAIISFYDASLGMLIEIYNSMRIMQENPDEEVTAELEDVFAGMEKSAVKYDRPPGSINPFLHANAMIPNIPLFTENTKHFGHVHVRPDADGTIRHHFPVIYYGRHFFPSLGIESASLFMEKKPFLTLPQPGKRPELLVGTTEVPLENDGTLLVNYFGPERYPHYSIFDIVWGKIYSMPSQDAIEPYFREVLNTTPEEYYEKEYGEPAREGDIMFMLQDVYIDDVPLAKHIVKWEGDQAFKNKYGLSPQEAFGGKVVLVGSTAAGAYDMRVTPFSENTPGVEIHATVIDSILTGKFLHTPTWKNKYVYAVMIVIAILMAFMLPMMRALRGAVITILLLAALLAMDYYYFFLDRGLWLPISYQAIQLGGLFLLTTLYRYATEEREKRFIKDTFGRYLAPSVVEHLTDNPELVQLGGEELELTAFFSDIQGFSTISEKLGSPKKLVDLLNDYLSGMANVIESYEGTIDKYEGDAIIAFWGAPLHFPDHAVKACEACLDQQAKLAELREKWAAEGKWPEIVHHARVRMGVNTGPMVVGNMGSAGRMNYTIMGDAVNLAARLEGANKAYGTLIMVAEDTYAQVKDHFEFRELDLLRVVGKSEPVRVYELISRKGEMIPQMQRVVELFNEGLEAYHKMDWDKSIEIFQMILNTEPDDGPSITYLRRCEGYKNNPPPGDWDGVFSMTEK